MAANKDMAKFVREALGAGHSRSEIETALTQAGWSPSEVAEGLHAWAETDFVPPVPRPQSVVSARDFFVYALTFGALIFLSIYFVLLCHHLIDIAFEDISRSYRQNSVRFAIAMIIVSGPLYLWLTLRDRAQLMADPSLYRSAIRKWLIYIALLAAASVFLGDLVATIYALLTGDLTWQFILKAGVTAITAGGVFLYYLRDIRIGDGT